MSDRSRSRSPHEEPRLKKQKSGGGFKWKDKRRREEDSDTRGTGRLERGYRDRSPRRDSYRNRSPQSGRPRYNDRESERTRRDEDRNRDRDDERSRDRPPPRRETDTYRPHHTVTDDARLTEPPNRLKDPSKPKKDKKDKKPKPPSTPSGPMIVVNINDRLGTKAAIPCLASDSVKAFKAIVAAHIGRQPHEIMLKRQGERPFKDQLTLEDYGVSNGVQLDLELDTGD